MEVEMWGRCPSCDRWFYCEGWDDGQTATPRCPVCGADPVELSNRGEQLAG